MQILYFLGHIFPSPQTQHWENQLIIKANTITGCVQAGIL